MTTQTTPAAVETALPTFAELGLNPLILQALANENYTHPTPIQAQALPVVMAGKDIIALAQTGTGKTAAFTLPLLHILRGDHQRSTRRGSRALILTPTRELAMQILGRISAYSTDMRMRTCLIVGGMPMGPQIRKMNDGADIIVATPGRLLDHMNQGTVHLQDTTIVVLDEADQMMDMGFAPALKEISDALPEARQTLMFSATMPPAIRALAKTFLKDPVEIKTANTGQSIDRVVQKAFLLDASNKKIKITHLLLDPVVTSAIVFTRTKFGADRLEKHLNMYGITSSAIHGDKSQNKRTRALDLFKQGRVKVLVATDVAARGIDVSNVSHVINFELPNVSETYLHRIGRTGRAGAEGTAWSLVDKTEKSYLRDIEKTINKQIETVDVRAERVPLPAPAPVDMSIFEEERGRRARPGRGDGDSEGRSDRASRYGKPDRADRGPRRERPERSERPARGYDPLPMMVDDGVEALTPDRDARPARAPRGDRAERAPRADRPERGTREDRPERAPRVDRAERAPRGEDRAFKPRSEGRDYAPRPEGRAYVPRGGARDGARGPSREFARGPRPEVSGDDARPRSAKPFGGNFRKPRDADAPAGDFRPRAPSGTFADRPARPERSARPERGERSERPAYAPRGDRPERGERSERPAFGDRGPRTARPERSERATSKPWGDRSERPARPAFAKPERSPGDRFIRRADERPRTAKPGERTARPARAGDGYAKPARSTTGAGRPAARPSAGGRPAGRGKPTGGR